jgi:ribonuclease BN (tRNA processing enzyme)
MHLRTLYFTLLVVVSTAASAAAQRRFTTTSPCSEAQRARGCWIVLGSGTPVPDPERAGPAYALVYGDRTFLFDAGAGVMRRAAAAGLPIDGFTHVFLTHLHSDHTIGLPDAILTTWVMGRRAPLPITGPPGTRSLVTHLLAAWREDIRIRTQGLERGVPRGERAQVRETRGGVVYEADGVRITAIRVPHGSWAHAFGYLVELPNRRIVLSGDTAPSPALEAAARAADLLVHEAYPVARLRPEDRPGGEDWPAYMRTFHTSDEEIARMATRAGVRHVVLSHVVWMGARPEEALAGLRRGGYTGTATVASDLQAF